MRYLSPEWLDAARDAMVADDHLAQALTGVTLTIEQTVEAVNQSGEPVEPSSEGTPAGAAGGDGAAGEAVTWHVAIDDGKVALAAGPAPRADVRFTTDRATAAAVAAGTLSAQRAFVEGRLRVGGDLSLLITHQRAVAAVDDALAPLRAQTSYE